MYTQTQEAAKCCYFTTPCGADYIECPNCYNYLERAGEPSSWDDRTKDKISSILQSLGEKGYCLAVDIYDRHLEFYMCLGCKYIFDCSHTFQENGCTESWMFYEYPTQFIASVAVSDITTIEQLREFIKSFEVKRIRCSCNGVIGGDNASYPLANYPEYYSTDCRLEWAIPVV